MVILESEYVEADEIVELQDKSFTIAKGAILKSMMQIDGSEKKKLVLPVTLSSGKLRNWIPNKTSENKLKKMYGRETDKWIGQKAEFKVVEQNVRGEMKNVIFVK